MSDTIQRNAVIRTIIDAVLTELMVKTTGDQVYLDEKTTLTPKIAEMITAINLRAKTADINAKVKEINTLIADIQDAVALKAESTDVDEQIANVKELISDLRQEMLGDVPVEAYNTFTELAAYISEHQEISDALTEAIGLKANQSTVDDILQTIEALGALSTKDEVTESELGTDLKTKIDTIADIQATLKKLGELATKDEVTEDDLDAELKEKVNAAADGNHSHDNKEVLDNITETKFEEWDDKVKLHISKDKPDDIKTGDLWFHTV